MAVAFDSVANGGGYPQITQNISGHSLAAGSGNRIVLGVVETIGPGPHNFDIANYNGVAMTQLTQIGGSIFGRLSNITVFYMLEADLPGAGTYTFQYRCSGAYGSLGAVVSYTGVEQNAPPFSESSDSENNPPITTPYSTNITLASSAGLIVDFIGAETSGSSTTGTPGTSQTEQLDVSDADEWLAISDKAYSSSGSNSMSWTLSDSYYNMAHVLVELAEAGGGGGAVPNTIFFGTNF